jgi:hypothetical protein
MQRIYLLLALFFLTAVSGCKKFLETKPTDVLLTETYYTSEEQLNRGLLGVYDMLGKEQIYGDYMTWPINSSTDESYQAGNPSTGMRVYVYDPGNAQVAGFWRAIWQGIARANVLLAGIDRPVMDEAKRDIIRGETLFLRGYYYFLLAINFGDVPIIVDPVLTVDNVHIARSPLKDVYAQILKDMTEAESLLQTQTITSLGYGGRVSKTAVQGILARVYLTMAGYPLQDVARYEDALYWARQVVQSGEHALNPDYKQIFINYAQDKYDVKESIWEIEFAGNGTGVFEESGRIGNNIGIKCASLEIGYSYGSVNLTNKLYSLYDSADLRRDWNCARYNYTGPGDTYRKNNNLWELNIGKWRREYETLTPKNKNFTPQNFAVLRYADVLLMLAEAENEINGPTAEAIDAVNQVRRRAYGKLLNGDTTTHNPDLLPEQYASKDALRHSIQDERSRELCFEALRKYDLIRWGIFISVMKDMADDIAARAPATHKFTASAANNLTSRHLLMPIPAHDMAVNRLLVQNPGW